MIGFGLKPADGLFTFPVGFDLIAVFVRFAASIAYGDVSRVIFLYRFFLCK
jgi:hypothetical protein